MMISDILPVEATVRTIFELDERRDFAPLFAELYKILCPNDSQCENSKSDLFDMVNLQLHVRGRPQDTCNTKITSFFSLCVRRYKSPGRRR